MTTTIRSEHGRKSGQSREVDLALAVACCLIRPGETLTHRQIAQITGMGHSGSYMIEQRALRKIRNRLKYTLHHEFGKEIGA